MRTLVTNCPNCAAPLVEGKCPYCGTHVRMANELDVDFNGKPIEVMLNIKKDNEVVLLPVIGRIQSIELNRRCDDIYCDDYRAHRFIRNVSTEVDLVIQGYVING